MANPATHAGRTYLVAGGGIVGAASALRLQAAGFAVTLIDPGDPRRGASWGNIGHIATEQVVPMANPAMVRQAASLLFGAGGPLDFRWTDCGLWLPWSVQFLRATRPAAVENGTRALSHLLRAPYAAWQALLALAGAPADLVRDCGHYVVWMNAKAAARGMADWQNTPLGSASVRAMSAMELAELADHIKPSPAGGVKFSGSGQVAQPHAVRTALLAAFAARGGLVEAGEVRELAPHTDGVIAHLCDGRSLDGTYALVAAGAWSGALMRQLGVRTPIIAERGYSIESAEHDWPAHLPPVVFEERSLVVTRFTSGLRASSFVEFGRPGAPPDPRKWRRIERHLRELGIAFSKTPDRWAGPRPTLPDYLPAIGRLTRWPNVFYAFGHQHLGLTLAAVTAELVEGLALDRSPPFDLSPFRIERFS